MSFVKINRLLVVGTLLLAMPFLNGCSHHAAETPPADNRLRDSLFASPQTFDPALCQSVPNSQLLQQTFEGLVEYDERNKVVPCLAQTWEVSKDGLTYTFHLRPGVTFQNGMPLTAADVAYSLSRALNPALKSQVAPLYLKDIVGAQDVLSSKSQTLSGVRVIDAETVAIRISSPKAYWLDTLTYPTAFVVCKSVVSRLPLVPLTDAVDAQGIGTGPFRLMRYKTDQEVDLDTNRTYWDTVPAIAGVTFKIIADPNTRHAEFVDGQLDIMREEEFGNYVTDLHDARLKESVHAFPRAGVYYLALNENVYPPFKDVRVRQALAYATDKETLSKRASAGVYPPAPDILPSGITGYDPNFQGLPYDPAKAKALLAAAGYPGGKGLPLLELYASSNRPYADNTVDLLRQMYQAVGIPVAVRQMEFGAMLAAIDKNNQIPCYFFGWYADYLDPQDFYSLLFDSSSVENHTGYANSRFDSLTARADVEQDAAKRMALYHQAAMILRGDVPRIPLYYASDPELVKPYVKGLRDCLMGHLPHTRVSFH